MKTIYKYKLHRKRCSIEMPIDAEILSCQVQNNEAYIWAMIETKNNLEYREFFAFNTGEEIFKRNYKKLNYIATLQFYNGTYVVHVFEGIE